MPDHSHDPAAIRARIAAPPGRGLLREAIYGGIDGSVTTFAIVAGVAGAGLSPFVILALGFANVLADGFSMAAGAWSGAKAERDNLHRIRRVEDGHIDRFPDGERDEVREILRLKGLTGDVLEAATAEITLQREKWVDLMVEGEYGLSASEPEPLKGALATFAAFLAAGIVPLMPFILGMGESAFRVSAILTLSVFFIIGTAKSAWSLRPWWLSGLETLAIGGVAAGLSYAVGTLFAH